jgi:hypothetical protein
MQRLAGIARFVLVLMIAAFVLSVVRESSAEKGVLITSRVASIDA